MAESELSVLSCQCRDCRIADQQTLVDDAAAWEDGRNKSHARAYRQFTTANAQVRLRPAS